MSTKQAIQDLIINKTIVDKKYTKYSVEDFTQDTKFINWVTDGTGDKEWEDFIEQNPELSKDIRLASKIVAALRYKKSDLDVGDINEVYKNIEVFYKLHHQSKRKIGLRKLMQYAAVLVLVLAVGAAIPIIYYTRSQVQFSETPISLTEVRDSRLITSGGKEILLKGTKSDLSVNNSGEQVKIDRDSIVDLDSKAGQMAELIVPYGKRSNIQLSDGTKVWLNAGSKLVFPQKFSGKNRKVFLKGEGYFEVAKNKDLPFIVSTNKIDIRVHGTKFNVNNFDTEKDIEVVLVEGEVGLKENNLMNLFSNEIKLIPNQKAVYDKLSNKTEVESNVDASYYISWTNGLLEFNKESILFVFERLSRYYNVRFVTDDRVELYRNISGKIDLKESLETVMKVISDAAPISFRISENQVFVNQKIQPLLKR